MAFQPINIRSIARFNSANSSGFLTFLESTIQRDVNAEAAEKPSQNIAPSSSWCPRINWFRLRGTDPDPVDHDNDPAISFYAMIGTAVHRWLQDIMVNNLKEDWISIPDYIASHAIKDVEMEDCDDSAETKLTWTDVPMRMAVDGVIRWNGSEYLIEIKTVDYGTFQNLTDPKPFHIQQTKYYCERLKLNKVLFLYVDRTSGNIKVYEQSYSGPELEAVSAEIQEIVKYSQVGIAPDKPSDTSRCNSNWCAYCKTCKEW